MKSDCIIFDLDGTLIDSFPGIIDSFLFAIEENKLAIPERAKVAAFIGEPLEVMFEKVTHAKDEHVITSLVKSYRRHYPLHGLHRSPFLPGAKQVLERLFEDGKTLAIASNKPDIYGNIVIKDLGIGHMFRSIQFNSLAGQLLRFTKSDLIRRVMEETAASKPVMVGDSVIDIRAAKETGIRSVACAFQGTADKLLAEGPDILIRDITELLYILD